jgi:hypothetical protein
MRWLGIGLLLIQLRDAWAQKVRNQSRHDWETYECAQVSSQQCVDRIANSIHNEDAYGQTMAPPDSTPQSKRRQCAGYTHSKHEHYGSESKRNQRIFSVWIEPPDMLERARR